MALEIIDGVLTPATPKSRKMGYSRFEELVITVPNGQQRRLAKISASSSFDEDIAAGGPGRYYFTKADAQYGMFGMRREGGVPKCSRFSNIETMILVVGLLGVLVGIAKFGFGIADLPLTPAVLSVLLLGFWFYMRSQRLTAEARFHADS